MRLTEWFRPRTRVRALESLATIAERYRMLAVNLQRHADECAYPGIRDGLQRLSAAKAEQAKDLSRFLATKNCAPSAEEKPHLDGSSNWRRLKADLALESQSLRELNQAIARLEGCEHQPARWLRDFAANEERYLGDLRDLLLKCDTYALD